jgi:mannosylglucosylglycerate synthase
MSLLKKSKIVMKEEVASLKIALAHFRVGETDGVSLEMEKWKLIFERMGHEVVFLAGSEGSADSYIIEELHYKHPVNDRIVENAYDQLKDYENEEALKKEVLAFAEIIEHKLLDFIKKENIDLIIPNNIWSLGWGLSAGIAFTKAAIKSNIKFLSHHHDFYWERERYSNPTCDFVNEFLEEYFPPNRENITHVVINHIAKEELEKRKGIQAHVVPNVFDFQGEPWEVDDYNKDFREAIGVNEEDILILQATRITERKAIELGVKVVGELLKENNLQRLKNSLLYNGKPFCETSKIVYVLAGLPESSERYVNQLKEEAAGLGVDIRFVNSKIAHSRETAGGEKIYSLWDAYVFSDLITYPSILEGWGNQLLEGVYAKKPMVIYEYPVYLTDIKDKGFSFVSLGDRHTLDDQGLVEIAPERIESAGMEVSRILADAELYKQVSEKNFEIGKQYYSYEALYEYLVNLPVFNETVHQ